MNLKALKKTKIINPKSSPNCLGTVLFVDTQKFNVNTQNSNFRRLKKLNFYRIGQLEIFFKSPKKVNRLHWNLEQPN